MSRNDSIRYEFDARPAQWCFPSGAVWITGWLELGGDDGATDVRAWIAGRIFLGLSGLPFEPANSAVPGRHRFLFLVEAGRGSRLLKLEAWSGPDGWTEFFRTLITVDENALNSIPALDWIEQLPRFLRSFGCGLDGSNSSLLNEVVRSAAAKPLNVLPAPPFCGALETPTEDGYVRGGRLLVSGWLAHGTQPIWKLTARVSGGPEATLAYGLQRRDVGEQFPELLGGAQSNFVGMVELPRAIAEPAQLLIFAETSEGSKSLVFARRFLAWERDGAAAVESDFGSFANHGSAGRTLRTRRSVWDQLRAACTVAAAVHRHGVPWWEFKRLAAAARAPARLRDAARLAAEGAFAESTPLSLYLSSLEDHEISAKPVPDQRACVKPDGWNILFVLHGDFSCASALHVLALAAELDQQGHTCIAAVPERLDTLDDHEDPRCVGILHAEALHGVVFPNGRGPDVLHAWTTRESVRVVVECLKVIHRDAKVLVHLEDNDQRILVETVQRSTEELAGFSDAALDCLVTPDQAHPRKSPEFLQSADGVTIVIDSLASFVPAGIPVQLITPAANRRYFYPRTRPEDFRRVLDPAGDTTILFYHGNGHPSNAAEMRELYAAVSQLNHTGSPVRLIRTGRDPISFLGPLANEAAPFVSELGRIRHHRHLAPLMALADMFIQPGWDNEFNAYRLPSKLPEFFSLGRPVILPRTNIGRVARHGVDAFVLERADCAHIVTAVKTLRADRARSEALARGAITFAEEHFSWPRSARVLAEFYASILTETSVTPR